MRNQGNIPLLAALEAASQHLGTLHLMTLYQNPMLTADIEQLQKLGLWYVTSITQGNITTAGAKALRDFDAALRPHPTGYEVMGAADLVDDTGDARFTNGFIKGLRRGSRDQHWDMVEYVRFHDCIGSYVGMSSMSEEIPLDVARWLLDD